MIALKRQNSQNEFLTDFVLTVYTQLLIPEICPFLPQMVVALAREQSH